MLVCIAHFIIVRDITVNSTFCTTPMILLLFYLYRFQNYMEHEINMDEYNVVDVTQSDVDQWLVVSFSIQKNKMILILLRF